ncbi:MAG: MMPL family transporter [Myxococcota bacterium]|nr:MMPL family transporter [Myxococcota bacterium]
MGGVPAGSRWIGGLVRVAVERPRKTLALWGVACLVGLGAVTQLRVDTTIGSALNRSDASWHRYQHSVARHGGDEFVAVALQAAEPFEPEALRAVLELTDRFEGLPDVRRVDSLATVPLIRPGPEGSVRVDAALDEDVLASEEARLEFTEFVRGDLIAPGSLVSRDERTLALNLVFDGDVDGDREASVRAIRKALQGTPARISGVPVVRADAGERTRREVLIFVPITAVFITVVLSAMFGSFRAVVVALCVGGASTLLCLATMASVGTTLSFSTALVPSVLLAMGCAFTMHLMTALRGLETPTEQVEAAQIVSRPITLSGLTTAIGFLAMATVRIEIIRDLAVYGALGVLLVTLATVSLGPALLSRWPLAENARGGLDRWIRRDLRRVLMRLVANHRPAILGVWVVLLAGFSFGIGRLAVASDVILWFPPDSELRVSYESIRARLSGITPVNVQIESPAGEPVVRPDVLRAVAALSDALEALPQVGKSLSVAEPLRQMHGVFSEDPEAGLPEDVALVQQYLLLLDGVEQMDDVITADQTSANILLRVDNNLSSEILALGGWVTRWWEEHGVAGFDVTTTGIMYEFGRSQAEIAIGGARGLSLAVLAIGALLLLMFGNLRVALVALVPNAIPIGMAFGFMGWTGIPLDAATVCLGSFALGIAVDDTIHVATAFQDGRRAGMDGLKALDGCFERVLPALVLTTITISAGFGVLGLSEFTLVRNLGLMIVGVVVVCLLADVLLLPALLLLRSRDG